MKTSQIKFSVLVMTLLLVGCGKPRQDDDSPLGVIEQKSSTEDKRSPTEADIKKAIETNNPTKLQELMKESQLDIKETKVGDDTPLIIAIKSNAKEVVDHLIKEEKVDLNKTNASGETPLMVAIQMKNKDLVMRLIMAKVKLDEKNAEGDTALHLAIRTGQTELARELIKHGANIRITDRDNLTPDEIAADLGLTELHDMIVKMLNVKIGAPDWHTFRTVILSGDLRTVKAMLAEHKGLAQSYEDQNPLDLVFEIENVKINDAQQILTALLSEGALKVNGPETALYAPIIKSTMQQKPVLLKTLIQYKANVEAKDKEGQTSLIHAVGLNNPTLVGILLDAKAEIKYKAYKDSEKKKVTYDACDVNRAIRNKLLDPKKIKDEAKKKEAQKAKADAEAIKEKLDCNFWDWLL